MEVTRRNFTALTIAAATLAAASIVAPQLALAADDPENTL